MSFILYMLGVAVVLGGIAWALVLMGVAASYIAIACLVIGGLGIMGAVARTRMKDPPN